MRLSSTVLSAPDAGRLADFYRRLLDWTVVQDSPGWVVLRPPDGGAGLSFQSEPDYLPPIWPACGDNQRMMLHLDIHVDDVAEAGRRAEAFGARLAHYQPQDDVRVYLDPAGHPFCLFTE